MNVLRQLIRCILAEDGKWGKFAFGQARQKDEPDTEEEKKAFLKEPGKYLGQTSKPSEEGHQH